MAWRRAQVARRHAIVISHESLGRYDAVEYERQVAQGAQPETARSARTSDGSGTPTSW